MVCIVELRKCDVLWISRDINADLYSKQLYQIYEALVRKSPALVTRRRGFLPEDNIPTHTTTVTCQNIWELEGIELLPCPAKSQSPVTTIYSAAEPLESKRCQNRRMGGLYRVSRWVVTDRIRKFCSKLTKCILHNGFYFEGYICLYIFNVTVLNFAHQDDTNFCNTLTRKPIQGYLNSRVDARSKYVWPFGSRPSHRASQVILKKTGTIGSGFGPGHLCPGRAWSPKNTQVTTHW